MKRNPFGRFAALALLVACGYVLSGCGPSTYSADPNLPKAAKVGTAVNKAPVK